MKTSNNRLNYLVAGGAALFMLAACEGGSFKKKNCKTCETLTSNATTQVNRNEQRVCGDDEVAAFTTANTFSNASLTVVTTCR